jgi:hypothetical protein
VVAVVFAPFWRFKMRNEMSKLDDLKMESGWEQVLQRTPRPNGDVQPPPPHRSRLAAAIVAAVVALGGLGLLFGRYLTPGTTSSGGELVSEVQITCTQKTTQVESDSVAVRDDGLHLHVAETSGFRAVALWLRDDPTKSYSAFEFASGPEASSVLPLPPGNYFIQCQEVGGSTNQVSLDPAKAAPLDVVDPLGFWTIDSLSCPKDQHNLPLNGVATADSIRAAVPGLQATDTIDRVGYPKNEDQYYQWGVTRDGAYVALIRDSVSGGGDHVLTIAACVGSGIAN